MPKLVKRLNEYHRQRSGRNDVEAEGDLPPDGGKQEDERQDRRYGRQGFAQASIVAKQAEPEEEKANLEARLTTLRGSRQHKEVTEEDLRGLFGMFRRYIRERDVPEIRKFLSAYVEKVIVYKDHVEVVFSFAPMQKGQIG